VFYGEAGMAYAVYRLASVRRSPKLLARADVWSSRARAGQDADGAFYNEKGEMTRRQMGEVSFFHARPGIEWVDALIAASRGDVVTLQKACGAFVETSKVTARSLELTLGRAGSLLGCALLLDAMAEYEVRDDVIYRFGNELHRGLCDRLAELPPIGECRQWPSLGAAHGWAGVLHALLLWRQLSGAVTLEGIRERVDQLAGLAEPFGEGVRWPRRLGRSVTEGYFSGWCNGGAGFVPLWTLAERHWNDDKYGDLARQAAVDVWTDPSDQVGDLCCGYAGRAYALLTYYRASGDGLWLERARTFGEKAVERIQQGSLKRDGLFKGQPGVALLAADLEQPESAAMPLFELLFT
ncbi:MAG: lanthionine synthetase LanC family protein, partial [Acidobacteriota bacterium]